jgi:hypothetical protein
MGTAEGTSWLGEISRLALMVTLPQMISSPVSVIIIELITPSNVVVDVITILDFFIISFPLTLTVAFITYHIKADDFSPALAIILVIGAAFLSNWLHNALSARFPYVDLEGAQRATMRDDELPGSSGIGNMLNMAIRIVGVYWRNFGPVLFIQSLGIGIYIGTKHLYKALRNE